MKQISVFFSALIIIILGISNAWALPNCPSSGYFHNCFGTYTWANGNKYVGEWQNNKRNGQGTYTWANGDKYYGNQNDKRMAKELILGPMEKYVGNRMIRHGKELIHMPWDHIGVYKNDKDGQGTYTICDGIKKLVI